MQCKARYCREKKELHFPLKSGYFTEIRCADLALDKGPDPELCEKCQMKSSKPFRVACQQGQYQGKIDEPYYDGSWLFGSDRFLRFNSIPGNALSADEFARAETAQKIARQDSEMKKGISPKKESKEGVSKKVPNVSEKVVKTRVVKTITTVPSTATPTPAIVPVGVELYEEPIEALEVVRIKLRPLEFDGKQYWYDRNTDIVYENRKKIGTWNRCSEKITFDFTDSSSEDV